jgi:hypothetical protein
VIQLLSMGMLPLGAVLGGILGRSLGLRAPFFVTGAALLVMALVAIPVVTTRAIEAARAAASTSGSRCTATASPVRQRPADGGRGSDQQ